MFPWFQYDITAKVQELMFCLGCNRVDSLEVFFLQVINLIFAVIFGKLQYDRIPETLLPVYKCKIISDFK